MRCSASLPRADESAFVGEHDRLDAVAHAELLQDARDVGLHGRLAEEEFAADLGGYAPRHGTVLAWTEAEGGAQLRAWAGGPPSIETLLATRRDGHGMPRAFYHDDALYAAEMRVIWHGGWLFAGFEFEIPKPGATGDDPSVLLH